MFNKFFSREDTDIYLLNQSDFRSKYRLTTESTYTMGIDNTPIKIKNRADIELEQVVSDKKKILTQVRIKNIINESDNPTFLEALKETELFTEIIPTIVIERSLRGEYLKIYNWNTINNNWNRWKEQTLPTVFPNPVKQRKVISNFESGLKTLEEQFNSNFQYTLLLPECYKYRDYNNPSDIGSLKKYSSRLVENLEIAYQLKKENFRIDQNKVELNLQSVIPKSYQKNIEASLVSFYQQYLPDFSYKQHIFDLSAKYLMNKQTSEIMSAEMTFKEELNRNLIYSMKFSLVKSEE
jgi:hypothetical protein